MPEHSRHLLTISADGEPRWVGLYVQGIVGGWTAMILWHDEISPALTRLKSLAIVGARFVEAEQGIPARLAASIPMS